MKDTELVPRIEASRAADYRLHVELYCQAERCPVRHVELTIKDDHAELMGMLRARRPSCPVCGEPATFHWVATREQYERRQELEARQSVNVQMRRRDRGAGDGLVVLTGADLTDDRLPPTPAGWWNRS